MNQCGIIYVTNPSEAIKGTIIKSMPFELTKTRYLIEEKDFEYRQKELNYYLNKCKQSMLYHSNFKNLKFTIVMKSRADKIED